MLAMFADLPLQEYLLIALNNLAPFFQGAVLYGFLLAVFLEAACAFRRKPFHDKLSLQLLQCLACAGVLAFLLHILFYWLKSVAEPPLADLASPIVVLTDLSPLLLPIPLCLAHQKLRSVPWLRFVLTAALVLFFLFWWGPGFKLLRLVSPLGGWSVPLSLWILQDMPPLLGLATAAALCQIWLVLRRNRADYGRDYYAFAMRACARLALAFTAAHMLCMALAFWLWGELVQANFLLFFSLLFLPLLLACLLWGIVSISAAPMRYKPAVVLACILLFLGGALLFFGVGPMLLSPQP